MIEPACGRFDIEPVRADAIRRPGEVPSQIYAAIRDWELVIADLTGANPNVMYELALRHSTGKCAIHIGEYTRLPFDIAVIRTEQFVRTEAGLIDARQRLESVIEEVLANGCDPLGVHSVMTLPAGTGTPRPAELAPIEAVGEPVEKSGGVAVGGPGAEPEARGDTSDPSAEMGFIDILAESEEAGPRVTQTLQEISGLIQELGTIATASTEEIKQSDASGKATFRDRLMIINRYGKRVNEVAERLEPRVVSYEADVARLDKGNSYILDRIALEPELRQELQPLLQALVRLADQTRGALESNQGFVATMERTLEASRVIRTPLRRVISSVNRMRSASSPILGWGARAEGYLQAQ